MAQKTVPRGRRKYDSEFKKEVLKMLESGRSAAEISEALGIGNNLVYSWKRQFAKGVVKSNTESELVTDGEKLTLQKRIRELEMERDILKKALGIFSRPM